MKKKQPQIAGIKVITVCLFSLCLILFSGYSAYSGGDDDPKVTPTSTPDPCSGCSSSVNAANNDASCTNCYRGDELNCLNDPDCTDWNIDYSDSANCSGWKDDPKCPSGNPRCPEITHVIQSCTMAGCCEDDTIIYDITSCMLVELNDLYYCLCADNGTGLIVYSTCIQ